MQIEEEIVTNQNRVTSILKSLVASRSLLTITLADSAKPLSTTLLDLTNEGMILDELVQSKASETIHVGSQFSAYSKNKGVPVIFKSEVQQIAVDDGSIYYVCAVPEYVKYNQKRTTFRLPAYGKQLRITMMVNDSEVECQLVDVSEGGAKILVEQSFETEQGREYGASISLQGELLQTKLRVCHVYDNVRRRVKELGVEFNSLEPRHRRKLRDWVFALERKRLRQG